MGLFDKTPLEQILNGSYTTRQRNGYAKICAVDFLKWFLTKNITNVSRTNPMTIFIDGGYLTVEELYNKFIEERKIQK